MNETIETLKIVIEAMEQQQKQLFIDYSNNPTPIKLELLQGLTTAINAAKHKLEESNWVSIDTNEYPAIDFEYDTKTCLTYLIPSRKVRVKTSSGYITEAKWGGKDKGWINVPPHIKNDIVAWSDDFYGAKMYSAEKEPELRLLSALKTLMEENISLKKQLDDSKTHESDWKEIKNKTPYLNVYNRLKSFSAIELLQVFDYGDKYAIMYRYSPQEIDEGIRKLTHQLS